MFVVKGWNLAPVVTQTAPKKKLKRKRDEKEEGDARTEETSSKGLRKNPFTVRRTHPPGPSAKPDPPHGHKKSTVATGSNDGSELKEADLVSLSSVKRASKTSRKAEKRRLRKLEAAANVNTDTPYVDTKRQNPPKERGVTSAFTPLQEKMRQKLSGSQFRQINEKLYTTHSSEALSLFTNEPSLFHKVHPVCITLLSSSITKASAIRYNPGPPIQTTFSSNYSPPHSRRLKRTSSLRI